MDPNDRNPLFIPSTPEPAKRGCPKCGSEKFDSRVVQGVVNRTCRSCGCKWQGGIPQEPVAPGTVLPPGSYVPPVRFGKDTKGNDVEIRRRINPLQEFRKGAPLPEGDE
jgi:hypothetical protein